LNQNKHPKQTYHFSGTILTEVQYFWNDKKQGEKSKQQVRLIPCGNFMAHLLKKTPVIDDGIDKDGNEVELNYL
jgi:hypothetical protein